MFTCCHYLSGLIDDLTFLIGLIKINKFLLICHCEITICIINLAKNVSNFLIASISGALNYDTII